MILRVGNRRGQAEAALKKGDRDKALKLLEKVLLAEPGDLKVRRQVADLYREARRPDDAIRHLEALAGGYAAAGLLLRAIAACKAILELDADHHQTQEVLARLYAKKRGGGSAQTLPPSMSAALAPPSQEGAAVELEETEGREAAPEETELDDDDILVTEEAAAPDARPAAPGGADEELCALGDEDILEEAEATNPEGESLALDDMSLDGIELRSEEELDVDGLEILSEDTISSEGEAAPDLGALPQSPLFSDLPRGALEELITGLSVRRAAPGEDILRQGDPGDRFYVVASGRVRVERHPEGATGPDLEATPAVLDHLEDGSFFGEMAILDEHPRTASVVAESETELLEVSRAVLDELKARYASVEQVLRRFCRARLLENLAKTSPLFSALPPDERRSVTEAFRPLDAEAGEVIIAQGETSKALFVILLGAAEVTVRGSDDQRAPPDVVRQLHAGDVFGEMGLCFSEPASATVTALAPCRLLRLSGRSFDRLCGRHPVLMDQLEEIGRQRAALNEQERSRPGAALTLHPSV